MSGTYPSTPSFNAVNFVINSPGLLTQTFSGKSRRLSQGHQYYTFKAQYPSITKSQFGSVNAFIAKQYGFYDSFQIVLPEISYSKATNKTAMANASVLTTVAAGAKTVQLTNVVTSKNQALKAGDFFKFSGHSKVYMCVDDVNSDINGNATLNFAGSLVSSVPAGSTLTIDAVPFTVIFDSDLQEYTVGIGGQTTIEVSMREVW